MRLLIDSDAFCKLAASGLLSDAAALFNGECGRLPALPHMLRRGQLLYRWPSGCTVRYSSHNSLTAWLGMAGRPASKSTPPA